MLPVLMFDGVEYSILHHVAGLTQGCPASCMLYIIAVDPFLAALQGVDALALAWPARSRVHCMALGNAMSQNVLERLLQRLLPSIGFSVQLDDRCDARRYLRRCRMLQRCASLSAVTEKQCMITGSTTMESDRAHRW